MSVREEITIKVRLEADDDIALASLRRYAVRTYKTACDNVRGGAVVTAIYDDDDNLLGFGVAGSPGEELKKDVEVLYENEPTAI